MWIVLDLCLLRVGSADQLAQEISDRTGVGPDRMRLSTTHAHSGPDTPFISTIEEPWARRYYYLLVEACTRAAVAARKKNFGEEETRNRVAEQFKFGSFLSIYKRGGDTIDSQKGEVRCPISILDFGAVKILGVPMEVLLDVVFHWQKRFPEHIALIRGLFGGWLGYLPHKNNYDEALATQLYETVSMVCAPDASLMLLEVAEGLVRQSP